MIVWGGVTTSSAYVNSGRQYALATDTWTAIETTGAPSPRSGAIPVWTGSEMIVWGGYDGNRLNSGGRYSPTSNSWVPTTLAGAPTPRNAHTAIWSGSRMVVWGGYHPTDIFIRLNTGGQYDPGPAPVPTPTSTPAPPTSTPLPPSQLTALSPAAIWVGLKNSDAVGIKFDLLAEVYKNETILVGSGQLDGVAGGSSGFNNARLNSIPLTLPSPVDFPSGSTLSIKLYVRNTCSGKTHNSGTARLWYNDSAANSHFDATIDSTTNDYFLRDAGTLATTVGSGPKKTIDVAAGSPCSSFKLFGTWSITP